MHGNAAGGEYAGRIPAGRKSGLSSRRCPIQKGGLDEGVTGTLVVPAGSGCATGSMRGETGAAGTETASTGAATAGAGANGPYWNGSATTGGPPAGAAWCLRAQ